MVVVGQRMEGKREAAFFVMREYQILSAARHVASRRRVFEPAGTVVGGRWKPADKVNV